MTQAITSRRAVLALGANLGEPIQALRGAVASLAATAGIRVIACSHAYRTDPVGGPQQPAYVNAVLIVQTSLAPVELLDLAQAIEQDWGRVRDIRWGPRTLDIDLISIDDLSMDDLSMDDLMVSEDRLTLPHPRAHERAFVLMPWLEIDPEACLPGIGPIAELVAGMDGSGVERMDLDLEAAEGSVTR